MANARTFFNSSDQKRRALLTEQNRGEVRGVLKRWQSTYGPGAPFAGGHEQEDPCRALKVGVGKSSIRKGRNKGPNQ